MNHGILILVVITFWLMRFAPNAIAASPPLPDLLQQTRFIAYTPRSFSLADGKVRGAATEAGIRKDLVLLRPYFNGLITYSAINGLENIPLIAEGLAYRALILGIWDPSSEIELRNVIHAAQKYPNLIGAIIVGNEGLYTKRYQQQDVQKARVRIKKALPDLPVTTSEPFFLYFEPEYHQFFNDHDLLMPNIHPVFEKWFTPAAPIPGVEMVVKVAEKFKMAYSRPLLIKETGMPSGPQDQGFSPKQQALFWSELHQRFSFSPQQSLACFEAFDAPWKPEEMAATLPGDHRGEGSWGFFTTEGKEKPVVDILPRKHD